MNTYHLISRSQTNLGQALRSGLAVLCLTAGAAHSTLGASRDAAFRSRELAPDPTWQALAGAQGAAGSGLSASMGNPAAAASLTRFRASLSHLTWLGEMGRESAMLGGPVGGRVHVLIDAALVQAPTLQGYDAEGQATETFRASEWNAGASLAANLGGGLRAGFGARTYRLEDPETPVVGMGLSGGLQWEVGSRRFGLSLTDLGSARSEGTGTYALPTAYRAGMEQGFASGSFAAFTLEERPGRGRQFRVGLGWRPSDWMELLGGMSASTGTHDESEMLWSGGLRLHRGSLSASYAFHPAMDGMATHQFGIELPLQRGGSSSMASAASIESADPSN